MMFKVLPALFDFRRWFEISSLCWGWRPSAQHSKNFDSPITDYVGEPFANYFVINDLRPQMKYSVRTCAKYAANGMGTDKQRCSFCQSGRTDLDMIQVQKKCRDRNYILWTVIASNKTDIVSRRYTESGFSISRVPLVWHFNVILKNTRWVRLQNIFQPNF